MYIEKSKFEKIEKKSIWFCRVWVNLGCVFSLFLELMWSGRRSVLGLGFCPKVVRKFSLFVELLHPEVVHVDQEQVNGNDYRIVDNDADIEQASDDNNHSQNWNNDNVNEG